MNAIETVLPAREWCRRAEAHRARVRKHTEPMRARRAGGEKHPVLDFLVSYYPYSLRKLEAWHPGIGITPEPPSAFKASK